MPKKKTKVTVHDGINPGRGVNGNVFTAIGGSSKGARCKKFSAEKSVRIDHKKQQKRKEYGAPGNLQHENV